MPKKPADDVVGHLVVLAAADAVDEHVGEAQPGEQRQRQGTRADLPAVGQQCRQAE